MHKNEENRFGAASNPPIVNCQSSIVNSRRAFTLVELLVVITIIGILSSLITVAVGGARRAVQRGKISMELGQIAIAIDKYKTVYGEYPPDLYEASATLRHVKKRWPRFSLASGSITDFNQAINNVYRNQQVLNSLANNYGYAVNNNTVFMGPDTLASNPYDTYNGSMYISAVPFWLGGFPNRDGKFDGFGADPQAPFGRIYDSSGNEVDINNGRILAAGEYVVLGTQTKDTVIEMEIGKQIQFAQDSAGNLNVAYPCFMHQVSSSNTAPYVYFRSRSGGGPMAYFYDVYNNASPPVHIGYAPKQYPFATVFDTSTFGTAAPYAKRGDPFAGTGDLSVLSWYEPDKFQLVHPGLGGVFGNVSDSGNMTIDTMIYTYDYFRSTYTDATHNNVGKLDFDNITNFSSPGELKALTE